MELYSLKAHELKELLKKGEVNSEEIVKSHLDRVDQVEDKVGAFLYVDREESIKSAKAFDEEGYNNYFTAMQRNIIRKAMLEFGNLVFEATKKECADKVRVFDYRKTDLDEGEVPDKEDIIWMGKVFAIDKESISNINKPNL